MGRDAMTRNSEGVTSILGKEGDRPGRSDDGGMVARWHGIDQTIDEGGVGYGLVQ